MCEATEGEQGSTSRALLCQIPSLLGSAPTGTHLWQQGLALLRVINYALFCSQPERSSCRECAYGGMCCAFLAFKLCQAW